MPFVPMPACIRLVRLNLINEPALPHSLFFSRQRREGPQIYLGLCQCLNRCFGFGHSQIRPDDLHRHLAGSRLVCEAVLSLEIGHPGIGRNFLELQSALCTMSEEGSKIETQVSTTSCSMATLYSWQPMPRYWCPWTAPEEDAPHLT